MNENIKTTLQQKMAMAPHIKAKVKFDLKDDGVIFIDTNQSPPEMSEEDKDADVTLTTSAETLEKILSGTQDPNIAFMMGKLKVKGSMGLAMKLNSVLED